MSITIPEIDTPTIADVEAWAYTIDWWALLIMIMVVAIWITLAKTQTPQIAVATILISALATIIAIANQYATPMDFFIFWGEQPPIGVRGRY